MSSGPAVVDAKKCLTVFLVCLALGTAGVGTERLGDWRTTANVKSTFFTESRERYTVGPASGGRRKGGDYD